MPLFKKETKKPEPLPPQQIEEATVGETPKKELTWEEQIANTPEIYYKAEVLQKLEIIDRKLTEILELAKK